MEVTWFHFTFECLWNNRGYVLFCFFIWRVSASEQLWFRFIGSLTELFFFTIDAGDKRSSTFISRLFIITTLENVFNWASFGRLAPFFLMKGITSWVTHFWLFALFSVSLCETFSSWTRSCCAYGKMESIFFFVCFVCLFSLSTNCHSATNISRSALRPF